MPLQSLAESDNFHQRLGTATLGAFSEGALVPGGLVVEMLLRFSRMLDRTEEKWSGYHTKTNADHSAEIFSLNKEHEAEKAKWEEERKNRDAQIAEQIDQICDINRRTDCLAELFRLVSKDLDGTETAQVINRVLACIKGYSDLKSWDVSLIFNREKQQVRTEARRKKREKAKKQASRAPRPRKKTTKK